jgi:hypothetical protein
MSNNTVTNFYPGDGVREVSRSEQALLTSGGVVTVKRLTILGRITTGGKYGYYASGNSDGTQTPVAVSLSEVVADGAGDDPVGVMLAGTVREGDLIIHGSTAGTGITDAIKDSLRTYGIFVESCDESNVLDNQT